MPYAGSSLPYETRYRSLAGMVNMVHQQHLQRRCRDARNPGIGNPRRDHNGNRLWMRRRLICGMDSNWVSSQSSFMVFRHQRVAAGKIISSSCWMSGNVFHSLLPVALIALVSAYGKCLRKQYRQFTAQPPFTNSKARLLYLCSRPAQRYAVLPADRWSKPGHE